MTKSFTRRPASWSPGRIGLSLAAALLVVVAVLVLVPGWCAGDPTAIDAAAALQQPSLSYPFGTDDLGRDQLDRIVNGARPSVLIGILATLLATSTGIVVGTVAGLGPRWLDVAVCRVLDVLLAFPDILLALLIVATLGPGSRNIAIAIAIGLTPGFARLVRIETMSVRRSLYVTAAIAGGNSRRHIVTKHIVPNVVPSLMSVATLSLGAAILGTATLSFLGLGADPPAPEWGSMLAESRADFARAPYLAVVPGLAITSVVVAIGILGRSAQTRFEGRDR